MSAESNIESRADGFDFKKDSMLPCAIVSNQGRQFVSIQDKNPH